jgi:phage tail sheath protein FI
VPTTPTYPGVYIEEVPSGVRTITPVGTSIAAFVDRFRRGPLNEAVRVTSPSDFEREFGGLDPASEASYGIQQFFLNGGTEAWVIRVANGATTASLIAAGTVPVAGQAFRVVAGRQIRGASAESPGDWGNFLRVEIDYDTVALPNSAIDPDGVLVPNELFNLTISEVEVRDGRMAVRQTESYRNLTLRAPARTNAFEVVNAGSRLVQLDRLGLAPLPLPPFRPDATGTLGAVLSGAPPAGPLNVTVTVDPDGPGAAPAVSIARSFASAASFAALRPLLEEAIRSAVDALSPAQEVVRPLLAGATVQFAGGRYRLQTGRSGLGFVPAATITLSGPSAAGLGFAAPVVGAQMLVPTTAGTDGINPTGAILRGTLLAKSGMHALEDVDLFNILCVPAAAELTAPGAMPAFYAAAEAYCESKRAFLIVDVPGGTDDPDAMETWLTDNATLRHKNAAVYFPRVHIPDPLDQDRLRSVGASGTMAGLYAQTDAARGVWKAPAGTDVKLRNVQDLDYVLTDRENGVLNPIAANALRNFPIFGHVAWGARTLDGADQQASEWKYIPVRRLALFLEESLYRGTKWVVFEPNDEPLWAQIRLNVGAFMHGLFRQGAFQGQTPKEAYFVKCDKETTTQADINLGVVNILVGFAPLKPAEFVIIKIQQMSGQIPT